MPGIGSIHGGMRRTVLLLAVLTVIPAAAAGCGGCAGGIKTPPDPTVDFSAGGEVQQARALGIYSSGMRVGTLVNSMQRGKWSGLLAGDALLFSETTEITVGYQENRFPVRISMRIAVREKDLALLAAYSETSFGAEPWVVSWKRAGEKNFLRREWAGGTAREDNVPFIPATLTMEALPMLLDRIGLRAGETRNLELFSLALRKPVAVTVGMQGESAGVRTFRLTMWAMSETVWVDEKGFVVKETIPLGIEARLPAAGEPEGALRLESLLAQASVPAVGMPDYLGDLSRSDLILEGIVQSPMETPWQKVTSIRRGARLTLTRPVPPAGGGTRSVLPVSKEAVLNLDSPYLRQVAGQITAGVDGSWNQAAAIGKWVYSNLGKTLRECTSALDVLRAGEGECQSHALLASALCQAAGIPTRFVSGLVYMPQRGAWFFHSWLEVHVGEWIPIDPTLGNFPAGVDHVALVYGNYLDQFQLAPFLFTDRDWRIIYVRPEPGPGQARGRD